MRPGYGGPPVSVGVSLYVLSVGEISYKFMDFTFDMYFRQFWTDDRLKFDAREVKSGIQGCPERFIRFSTAWSFSHVTAK